MHQGCPEHWIGSFLVFAGSTHEHATAELAVSHRPVLGCAKIDVGDRLAAIGVSACFGLHSTNVGVERETARRALGIEFDPDEPRIAGHDLWDQFRKAASVRCPVFILPPDVPEKGTMIRIATRIIAVDVAVDKVAGTIALGFDLHPVKTGRR